MSMAIAVGSMALSGMTGAIHSLYKMGGPVNDFLDVHIVQLKNSDNQTISSTGKVLEAAKAGFGIGYLSSFIVIATGQVMLGNTLTAAATVATAVTFTNPIAMTCAAVGAIYYGWGALSENERNSILDRLAKGFEVGIEMIRSVVEFVVTTTKNLFSSKQLAEYKDYVRIQASQFGRSFSDITGKWSDRAKDATRKVGEITDQVLGATNEALTNASNKTTAVGKGMVLQAGLAMDTVVDTAKKVTFQKSTGGSDAHDEVKDPTQTRKNIE